MTNFIVEIESEANINGIKENKARKHELKNRQCYRDEEKWF